VDERQNAARQALASVPINAMFAQAALDLGAPLWSDREADARAFHVVHPYGMSFVWGPAVDEAFPLVVSHLAGQRAGEEWLQVEPRWTGLGWDDALGVGDASAPGGGVMTVRHTRVNFAFDEAAHAVRRRELVPPDGWVARRATAEDFGWPGSVVPNRFWSDAASFLAQGGGVVLTRGGELGAMAFASYRQESRMELGIETAPRWRRRGLAAAAATAMIDVALDGGLTPVWSCREDNVGSFRLATALGFTPTTRTPYYHLVASGPGGLAL
jgi:RimJ/RimL family protein N-acetyltransferase